jgi:hypothetical protein
MCLIRAPVRIKVMNIRMDLRSAFTIPARDAMMENGKMPAARLVANGKSAIRRVSDLK